MEPQPGVRIETTTCYVNFTVEFGLPDGVVLEIRREGRYKEEDVNAHSLNLSVRASTPIAAKEKLEDMKEAIIKAIVGQA